MRIDLGSLVAVLDQLESAKKEIETTAIDVRSDIVGNFSAISGLNEAGLIHGRAVKHDPASAQEQLHVFADFVGWATELLAADLKTIQQQESTNADGIDLADAGGSVNTSEADFPAQPVYQSASLSYVPPIVAPGASLLQLVNSFNATNFGRLGEVAADWGTMASNIQRVVEQLDNASSKLESENESEFTGNAANKIREMAVTGEQFVSNATVMQGRAASVLLNAPLLGMEMPADLLKVSSIPEPAVQKTVEAAMLAKWQMKLQQMVTNSLPNQQSLTEPPKSYGAGDSIDIGLEAIAGTGTRYSTDEVEWPEEIQDAIKSGEIGPGAFGVADGELVALENIDQGLVDQVRQAINDRNESLYGGGRLQEFLNSGMQTLEEAGTHTAGVQGSTGGTFNGGVNPAMGQAASGSGAIGGSNLGFGSGSGALGTLGGVGGPSALGNSNTGLGSTGVRSGIPGTGLGSARGSGGGVSGGRAFGAAGGEGSSRVLGGSGDTAGRAGANTGTSSQGAGSGAAGAGSNGQHGRGMGSMMAPGGAARNQEKKKSGMIKAVTSRVEADKNRRDLLGEPPAALPGPIGDWARQ